MRFGIFIAFLLFSNLLSAAYVYGTIYKGNFEQINRTIIHVEGSFSYQLVTEKANYSIFLPEGEYKISGQSNDQDGNPILYGEEKINVGGTDQRVDLILKPIGFNLVFLVPIILLLVVAAWFFAKSRGKQVSAGQIQVQKTAELDNDAKSVLRALDSFEGRATQKELKETLKFSDAKLSLILTELEYSGLVKKFKRGRANIIKKL